ncbi:MAG TPA: hypothetical protein VG186_10425 [Solirubrobacteraceae bacterium]|nr:hypothetical protein [Solirubrobacteraceae bacterium]
MIETASEPNAENDVAVDLGPFAHNREAVLCRCLTGDHGHGHGHGLDAHLEAAS